MTRSQKLPYEGAELHKRIPARKPCVTDVLCNWDVCNHFGPPSGSPIEGVFSEVPRVLSETLSKTPSETPKPLRTPRRVAPLPVAPFKLLRVLPSKAARGCKPAGTQPRFLPRGLQLISPLQPEITANIILGTYTYHVCWETGRPSCRRPSSTR